MRGKRAQFLDRNSLVDLMDGRVGGTEFQNRAIVLDEPRIGRAAGGRELWREIPVSSSIASMTMPRNGPGSVMNASARSVSKIANRPPNSRSTLEHCYLTHSIKRLRAVFGVEPDIELEPPRAPG